MDAVNFANNLAGRWVMAVGDCGGKLFIETVCY